MNEHSFTLTHSFASCFCGAVDFKLVMLMSDKESRFRPVSVSNFTMIPSRTASIRSASPSSSSSSAVSSPPGTLDRIIALNNSRSRIVDADD